jgi:hypothetical protein
MASSKKQVFSINELVSNPIKCLGEKKSKVAKFLHSTKDQAYQISVQNMIFDGRHCVVLTYRDIT